MTLSSVSVLVRETKWIDVCPEHYCHDCFEVSKAMIRFLRHDQSVPREDDGGVRFDEILEDLKKKPMVFCNGQLANGYLFWVQEEGPRKGFSIV